MRIIARSALRDFWEKHPNAEEALRAWFEDAEQADWQSPQSIKNVYRSASILSNNRVVFNIKGNDYRLIVKIHYNTCIVYIRFIGTHHQYDQVDAEII